MPSATVSATGGVLMDIVLYILFLWFVVTVISFIVGMINRQSCCTGPQNSYEHFQDANTVDNHIYTSLIKMTVTFDQYTQNLQSTINETGSMKAQTCSIYEGVRDKFVKSTSSEAPDQSEYQLPPQQQKLLRLNRAKNSENTWANQIALYKWKHQEGGMLDCTQINAETQAKAAAAKSAKSAKAPKTEAEAEAEIADAAEGFQNAVAVAPATLAAAADTLQGKISIFNQLLGSPVVKGWIADCVGIRGTANYLNMYINNIQVNSMIDKCIAKKTNVPGFKVKSGEDQEKITNGAKFDCQLEQMKNGPRIENFQDYVNTQFSFPVPFPTSGLTPAQIDYYKILSGGQDSLTKFSQMVGTNYQTAIASYRRMNNTNNTYITYRKQVDSVQESNYNKEQAQSLNS